MKNHEIYKPGHLLTGIYKKNIIELVIDYKRENEVHCFKDADGLRVEGNVISNNKFYYETLCVIEGKLRCPVYNDEVYAGPEEENVTLNDFIESLGQLCLEYTQIHKKAKEKLVLSKERFAVTRDYANKCLELATEENDKILFNELKNKLKKLETKLDLNKYKTLISEIDEELTKKSYDDVIDTYKHNLSNPKFKKQYDSLENDIVNLCSYVLYLPLLESQNLSSFLSLRNNSKERIEKELSEIAQNKSITKVKANYERIVNILT